MSLQGANIFKYYSNRLFPFLDSIFDYLSYSKPKLIIYDAVITTLDKENPASDYKFFNTISRFNNLIVGFMPRFQAWENEKQGEIIENNFSLNDDVILCLHISEKNKESKTYKIPIIRRKFWERPYYFDISKKKLINFIK